MNASQTTLPTRCQQNRAAYRKAASQPSTGYTTAARALGTAFFIFALCLIALPTSRLGASVTSSFAILESAVLPLAAGASWKFVALFLGGAAATVGELSASRPWSKAWFTGNVATLAAIAVGGAILIAAHSIGWVVLVAAALFAIIGLWASRSQDSQLPLDA